MPTPRKPTIPTAEAMDQFCASVDPVFTGWEERQAFRHSLIGLLLPREHHKTVVELAAIVPGANRQQLHHVRHDAPWDAEAVNRRRLEIWPAHPSLGPPAAGVLIIDETGDPKRGQRIEVAAQHYVGKLGQVAHGVVAVTSQWADGTRHRPLGVKPYRPARRLPNGKADPAFHTKPDLAWTLIEEARAAGIPFPLVVADSVSGEKALLASRWYLARIPYIMGLRPAHGTWQFGEDPEHPPAFTPAEAAQRVPLADWQRTVRLDSHGKELVRYLTELELPPTDGPTRDIRLIAAPRDPVKLDPDSTWSPFDLASHERGEHVDEIYRLRDWIEHDDKPVKHELGWADSQMRPERAMVRHWQVVMVAFPCSLLMGSPPSTLTPNLPPTQTSADAEKKRRPAPASGSCGRQPCDECGTGCVRGHDC